MQKEEYNEGYDFEQFSSSDSLQFSDSSQDQYEIPLGINEDFKKIEDNDELKMINKEDVTEKPENNKIANEEFKKKGNQEKNEV